MPSIHRSMTPLCSVQCVNNGLTSVSLAPAPLRCQDPIRERVNSQTDYPSVNSDVYENPIQIYANSLLSPHAVPPLSLLCYYRNVQGATNSSFLCCRCWSVKLASLQLWLHSKVIKGTIRKVGNTALLDIFVIITSCTFNMFFYTLLLVFIRTLGQ